MGQGWVGADNITKWYGLAFRHMNRRIHEGPQKRGFLRQQPSEYHVNSELTITQTSMYN